MLLPGVQNQITYNHRRQVYDRNWVLVYYFVRIIPEYLPSVSLPLELSGTFVVLRFRGRRMSKLVFSCEADYLTFQRDCLYLSSCPFDIFAFVIQLFTCIN